MRRHAHLPIVVVAAALAGAGCLVKPDQCLDGILDPGEQCDDGNANESDFCTNTCQWRACGDGFTAPDEECDDGNADDTDGCTIDCVIAPCEGQHCYQPVEPGCGDGEVTADEVCDDGNGSSNDQCRADCQAFARCGDGLVQAGVEECDDGNDGERDGCLPSCRLPDLAGFGHVTYRLPDGHVYRVEAREAGEPVDLSVDLDALSPGADMAVSAAPDGQWLVLETERFGCAEWACLAVVQGDLATGEAIWGGGHLLHPEGPGLAVASGGRHVVYAAAGVHGLDLYVTTRSLVTGAWSLPRSITDDSPFDYHHHPSISDDGQRVLFDCGAEPFGVETSAICEVGLDGKGFRPVVEPLDGPADLARPISATHHADYAPDGSIVFESDWGGESIWRLRPGDRALGQVGDTRNDNSPCVLWDGRIASLWLQRPGGASTHEIKVTDPMGRSPVMVQTDVDVMDVGISCSR